GESLREKRLSACAIAGILTDQDARRSRVLASPILGAQFSGEGALRSGAQVPTYVHCACGAPSPGARSVGTSVPWGLRSGARESLAAGYQGSGGARSEERRVGKECRSRWSPYPYSNRSC